MFGKGADFATYLNGRRRQLVIDGGWKTARIETDLGCNKTGVFRNVLGLLRTTLKSQGGSGSILDFQMRTAHSSMERVFLSPWNAEVMRQYTNEIDGNSKVILVDLFSDGTCLSNSGTQSANLMRIRFSNILGKTKEWHEIGITPVPDLAESVSDARLRLHKLVLWQRFTFLAMKEVIEASHTGIIIDGIRCYPRLGMLVTDQVQERPMLCLKGHDSFFDCSFCMMPSKGLKGSEENFDERESPASPTVSRTPSLFSETSHDQQTKTDGRRRKLTNEQVLSTQLGKQGAPRRDVFRTVRSQVAIATHRQRHRERMEQPHARRLDGKRRLEEAQEDATYLFEQSAAEYLPCLAAFAGAGSFPYRLYLSVGFDVLHVWALGIVRKLTDDAFHLFKTHRAYFGSSK